MLYWNCRSLINMNKRHILSDFINSNGFDFICLTETWFSNDINNSEIYLDNFNIIRKDRNMREHGGVCIAIRKEIYFTRINLKTPHYDVICIKLNTKSDIIIAVIYNSPKNSKYRSASHIIENLLSEIILNLNSINMKGKTYIAGDFNLPNINWSTNDFLNLSAEDHEFISMLDRLNINQIVDYPTHNSGNIIDLIITNDDNCTTHYIKNNDLQSDHNLISIQFNSATDDHSTKNVKINSNKKWTSKNINQSVIEKLNCDLLQIQKTLETSANTGNKFQIFESLF